MVRRFPASSRSAFRIPTIAPRSPQTGTRNWHGPTHQKGLAPLRSCAMTRMPQPSRTMSTSQIARYRTIFLGPTSSTGWLLISLPISTRSRRGSSPMVLSHAGSRSHKGRLAAVRDAMTTPAGSAATPTWKVTTTGTTGPVPRGTTVSSTTTSSRSTHSTSLESPSRVDSRGKMCATPLP